MPSDDLPDLRMTERDMRALAMTLALQLPRDERDAQRIMDLMRAGYEFFLCETQKKPDETAVVRPRFRR